MRKLLFINFNLGTMTITFKDTPIYYTAEGQGNPIVLLHGFLESGSIWNSFIAEFGKRRQIINIDLPGHGQSGVVSEEHSMELMAEAVDGVLQQLGLEKVDLLGHSMGGYVALAFLERYPEKVRKIILLNSTTVADSDEKVENRERSIELVKKNKKAYVSMSISNLLTPMNLDRFQGEVALLKEEAAKFPTEGITAALKGMKNRTDRTGVLKHFHGPKFILTGEQDPLLEYQEIEDIAEETRSKLYAFPGGHLSYLENKGQFLKIVQFIE